MFRQDFLELLEDVEYTYRGRFWAYSGKYYKIKISEEKQVFNYFYATELPTEKGHVTNAIRKSMMEVHKYLYPQYLENPNILTTDIEYAYSEFNPQKLCELLMRVLKVDTRGSLLLPAKLWAVIELYREGSDDGLVGRELFAKTIYENSGCKVVNFRPVLELDNLRKIVFTPLDNYLVNSERTNIFWVNNNTLSCSTSDLVFHDTQDFRYIQLT